MKWFLKAVLAAAACAGASRGFAQGGAGKQFESEGRMIVFRLVPGDKSAQLFLVGRKAGELKAGDARLTSVRVESGARSEELRFREDGTSYLISPFPKSKDVTLSLKAEVRGQPEHAKIRVRAP